MAIQDSLAIGITFDLPVLPFFGLQDTTDYLSEGIAFADVKGNFTIINPIGEVYSNTSWTTPDIHVSVSAYFNSVLIPLFAGKPLPGEYTFEYTIQVSGAVQPGIYTITRSFIYGYESPVVKIAFDNNPYVTLLTSTDVTNYIVDGVYPTVQRSHNLVFPELSEIPEIVTADAYIAVTNPFYVDGQYQSTVTSELTYDFEDFVVHDIITGSAEIMVEDTIDIQSIYCCLKKLNEKIVINEKVNPTLAERDTRILNRATQLLTLFKEAVEFGRYPDANNYIQQIYDVTGCTKGCTCGSGGKTAIQPYWQTVNTPSPSSDLEIGDIIATFRTSKNSNWIFLENQILKITDYQEYYNIVGTMFNTGGEPSGYFRNEDGRSRSIVGAGQGVGLTNRVLGQKYGAETSNATHSHGLNITIVGTIPAIEGTADIGVVALDLDPFTPEGDIAITSIVMSAHDISGLGVDVTATTVTGVTSTTALSITGTGTLNPSVTVGIPGLGTLNTNVSAITVTNTTVSTALSISGTGSVAPSVTVGIPGLGTLNTNVSAVTVTNTTGTQSLSISGTGSVSPIVTVGIPGLGTLTTAVSAVTVANTTGTQALTITGTGTLTPTVTVGIPGLGTLNTNVSAVTVANTTGTQSLTITGSGTVTSNTVSGVTAVPSACVLVTNEGAPTQNVARCLPITVSDFTVGIAGTAIAAALAVSPNPHSHSIPALAVTVTQGLTGALAAPSATSSIAASAVAAALSVSPDPHSHSIPALAVTVTQGLTGSLAAPSATSSLAASAIAGVLSITPNPHSHSIPALAVTVTQGLTGSLAAPTATSTILASTIASALSITPNPHNHVIPALGVTVTQGLTGSLAAPSATSSIAASAIAAALSISPDPHDHDIPALDVSGTGVITGSIPDHTFVSGTATFTGVEIQPTGSVDLGTIEVDIPSQEVNIPFTGTTESTTLIVSIIPPVFAANWAVKVY